MGDTYTGIPTEQQLEMTITRDEVHDYALYPIQPSIDELKILTVNTGDRETFVDES